MRLPIATSILILAAGPVLAPALAPALADPESEFRGRRIAEANCQTCHAIGQVDHGGNPAAPPFREMWRLPGYATLRADLLGQVFLRHAVMPDFEPTREQAADLADYIDSVRSDRP